MRLRFALTGLLVLLLAACASPPPPPVDKSAISFDASSEDALIVVGFGGEYTLNSISISMWWTCYDPASGKICPERDPNSPKNFFGVPQKLSGFIVTKDRVKFPNIDLRQIERTVHRVKPGNYIFAEARHMYMGLSGYMPSNITRYVDRDKTSADTKTPRFRVEPGKAYYLGDFLFDFSRNPPPVKKLVYDLAAARRDLAEYPNVRVQLAPVALRTSD